MPASMNRIDSPANPRVIAARRSLDKGEAMPIEGVRMLREALEAGVRPESVFFLESGYANVIAKPTARSAADASSTEAAPAADLTTVVAEAGAKEAKLYPSSSRVLSKLSDLPSSRDLVALAAPPRHALSGIHLSDRSLVVLLDSVQDPANVGAIIRSAEAFGAGAVLLTAGSASPFSARALRASAGSAFRIPVVTDLAVAEAVRWARREGATLAGADAHQGEPPETATALRPLVLAVGSEGHGFSEALASALDRRLTIPLKGRIESLNAAVAAGVLLDRLTRR